MKVIWKYTLGLGLEKEVQSFKMPRWSTILCVQMQDDVPVMWALVDPSTSMEERTFILAYTGEQRSDLNIAGYIGTFQSDLLVYHVFEELEDIPF